MVDRRRVQRLGHVAEAEEADVERPPAARGHGDDLLAAEEAHPLARRDDGRRGDHASDCSGRARLTFAAAAAFYGHGTHEHQHDELVARCHAAGQLRPTPLIPRYCEGDWNALHQDLYGDVYFPFQVLTVLSEPGIDFQGGQLVLLEQRARAQSRAHVIEPPRGAFVVFPTQHRPQRGARGYYRVGLRHGVSTITSGSRTALGLIFHDAR
jgi:hypothetical protein